MARSAPSPMRTIVEAWLAKIELAQKVRDRLFGCYASEAEQFFDGEHDFMWKQAEETGGSGFLDVEGQLPHFRIQVNKLFEAVALFGPALYAQNPNALVSALLPPEVPPEALGLDPADPYAAQQYQELAAADQFAWASKKACASVKTCYLNWLQTETDKKTQARRAITESLVAGVGYLETTIHRPPGSQITMPRSRYLSWRDVVVDPDARYWDDVQWIALRRCQPVNLAERRWGEEPGTYRGHYQSYNVQPSPRAKKEAKENREGKSFDLLEYWEVFSKNGFGDRLFDGKAIPSAHAFDYAPLGDYCYLACARGIPHPLNLPPRVLTAGDASDLYQRAQWPIPFWYDDNGWPISRVFYYDKPGSVWPISLFKPAIGELRFVNWCLSFLADKVAANCRTYIGVLKEAGEEIRRQIVEKTGPYNIIEIATALGKPLDQLVSFLQAPAFSIDIWKMIAEVLDLIDKRTGLTELIYGLTAQSMRSATEANIKSQNVAVRPDDMASKVEDWLGEVEIREMQAAQWYCTPQDVQPSVGTLGAMVWERYVMPMDVDHVVRGFDYRIEAGSARKPNKANKAQQLLELGQYLLPVLQEFAGGGVVEPWNAYISDMARNLDLDPSAYLLQPPQPQEQGPSPEQQQLELKFVEMQLKFEEMQQRMGMTAEAHDQELDQSAEKHEQEMAQGKQRMALEKEKTKSQAAAAKARPKSGAKR